jgi:hypothetical protein
MAVGNSGFSPKKGSWSFFTRNGGFLREKKKEAVGRSFSRKK